MLEEKVNDELMFDKEKVEDQGRLKGFLEGDSKAYDMRSKSTALDRWIAEQKTAGTFSPELVELLTTAGWRLKYRFKPATPEEFLSPEYIGDQAYAIWAPLKKAFPEYLDRHSKYRTLCMYTAIGWGKTLFLDLVKMYIIHLFGYMWQPWKFFGHAQPLSSEVLLTNGMKTTIGDIKVGDIIFSPTEGSQVVEEIIPQGIQDTYEIELEDGSTVRCNGEHYWTAYNFDKKSYEVITTKELMLNKDLYGIPDIDDCKKDHLKILKAESDFRERELLNV